MNGLQRLSVIQELSKNKKDWKHKELFRLLRKDDIWVRAYENIKSNKGLLTPGRNPQTLDGVSIVSLKRLQEKVVNESYQFSPVKQIEIPKPDAHKRSLGLPTENDKIVQEVIRMILEAIYEPCFSEVSFGFRRGLGPHDALEHLESRFRWVDWVIESNIQSAYPTIDNHRLFEILGKKILDTRFMNLIRKSLKWEITYSSLDIPQGSIVSPILANIYYHELDLWIKEKATTLNKPKSNTRNPRYKQISYQINKLAKKLKNTSKNTETYKTSLRELKLLKKKRNTIPSLAEKHIQIEYVRYADGWIIGIAGDKSIANQLKVEVSEFLESHLKQSSHPNKTKLTDLRAGKAKFLGYEIYLPRIRAINADIGGRNFVLRRRTNHMLRFDIPIDSIIKKLDDRGYVKTLASGCRPISKSSYTPLEDTTIINHFKSVWLGIAIYYSGCTNISRLQYIHYLLHMSCAMTLAHRHRSSASKIFAKHGKTLTASDPSTKQNISFPSKTSWSLDNRKWQNQRTFVDPFTIYANRVSRSKLNHLQWYSQACRICKSTEDELKIRQK